METYRILAQGQTVSNDTWATGLNNNDLIIGPSGAGKTRGYVLPNILQASESLIVTDTKGTLRQQAGAVLERNGYTVREIDLTDCLRSPAGTILCAMSVTMNSGTAGTSRIFALLPPLLSPWKTTGTRSGSMRPGWYWKA